MLQGKSSRSPSRVPQLDGLVPPSSGKILAVGAKSCRAAGPFDREQFPPRDSVVNSNPLPDIHGDVSSVGAECWAEFRAEDISPESKEFLPRAHVPYLHFPPGLGQRPSIKGKQAFAVSAEG